MSVIANLPSGLQLSINFDVLGEFDVYSIEAPADAVIAVSDVRLDELVDRATTRASRVIDLVALEARWSEPADSVATPDWLREREPEWVERPSRSRRIGRRHRSR